MRIDVTYADAPPRVIETSGESLLSASTVSCSPEWAVTGLPVTAVQLRPRTDLLADGKTGLIIEICVWSSAVAEGRGEATLSDYGKGWEVPRLLMHVFRVWEVLPAEEVARAVDIEIDGRIHLLRVCGSLLDLTAYERLESTVLSQAERSEYPLDRRVLAVHERMAVLHPELDDEGIGALYGLGCSLVSYARRMGGEVDAGVGGDGGTAPSDPHDGLDEFFEAMECAGTRGEVVEAVATAILDHPDMTLRRLSRACEARGIEVDGIAGVWDEAVAELDGNAYG